MQQVRRRRPGPGGSVKSRGGARVVVALVLALVAAVAIVWFLRADDSVREAPLVAPAPAASATHAPTELAVRDPSLDPPRDATAVDPDVSDAVLGPERFVGTGRVRGEIVAPPGLEFPSSWTLVLEPHHWIQGAEHATKKRVELTSADRTFDVKGLSLGGYRVRAEAPGFASSDASALLVTGSADVYVTLTFLKSGYVDGVVRDDQGAPAGDLAVTLESRETRERREVLTDPAGGFLFADVLDGPYVLYLGSPEAPIAPPRELAMRAPSLRVGNLVLPATGSVLVTTTNEYGAPVPDCAIDGFGEPAGSVRSGTGTDGTGMLRWLLPGRWSLRASAPDGRTGRTQVEVKAGVERRVHVPVRR